MKNKKKLIILGIIIAIMLVVLNKFTYSEVGGNVEISSAISNNQDICKVLRESEKLKNKASVDMNVNLSKGTIKVQYLNEDDTILWEGDFKEGANNKKNIKLKGFKTLKINIINDDAYGGIDYTLRN